MRIFIIIILPIFTLQENWAHGGVDHSKEALIKGERSSKSKDRIADKNTYKSIGTQYLKKVKPILKKSCFDCHSNQTKFPWYYKIPGVRQFIDSDIKEAKFHLDFSKDYPFISHDSPKNDLKSIAKSISEGTMPPKKYLWLHKDAKLSKQEIEKIKKWITESLEALK